MKCSLSQANHQIRDGIECFLDHSTRHDSKTAFISRQRRFFSSIGYLSWFLWCSTIDFTFTTLHHFFKTSFVRLQNVMCVLNARSYTLQQQSAQEKSFANSNKNCNVRHKSHNTRETMLGVYQCVTSFAICFSPLAHLQPKCLWSMSNGSSECCG